MRCLAFCQADELRTDLPTINDATKEVQCCIISFFSKFLTCMYSYTLTGLMFHFGQVKRVTGVTADNADHSNIM